MSAASSDLHLGLVKLGSMFSIEQDLDLISANAGDDRRVQQLRQLLLSQLDLIQKQSEVILTKDQIIKELKRDNEALQKRVAILETATEKIKTKHQQKFIKKEEINEELEDMETEEPYFTLQNETRFPIDIIETLEDQKKAEVPGFRLKPVAPSYIMEGTENIEDETLLKRHQKPENEEKRRKRWDVQRIREQRHVARLRARYDSHPTDEQSSTSAKNSQLSKLMPLSSGESSKDSPDLKSLVPNPEEATEIIVQHKLPVSVFGCVLPKLGIENFTLPWLTDG